MSYGWLTESAFLPKKSKLITLDEEGSLFALKAVMRKEKEKSELRGKEPASRPKGKEPTGRQSI